MRVRAPVPVRSTQKARGIPWRASCRRTPKPINSAEKDLLRFLARL